jgi:hypothetical protein
LGDISTLQSSVATNTENIGTLQSSVTTNTANIGTLNTRTTGLLDYVIASQAPSADNNYTWYRKYKSGWVEQGGIYTGNSQSVIITLPIKMANTNYTILSLGDNYTGISGSYTMVDENSQGQTGFMLVINFAGVEPTTKKIRWYVCGIAE